MKSLAVVVFASFGVLASANFNPQQFAAPRSHPQPSNTLQSQPPNLQQQNHQQQQSSFVPNNPTFLNEAAKSDRIGGYGPPPNLFGNPSSGYPGGPGSFGLGPGGLGGGGGGGAAPVIHKHVYVHVPPPEPQAPRLRRPSSPPPPPQKHYKIIFIKAPTPPPPEIPEIPPMPETETKTLVYVLVKKPEPAPAIRIPTPPPTKPSKPEVYFIRYNTPGGADAAASLGIGGPDFAPAGGDIGANTISTDFGAAGQQYGAPSF